MCLSVIFQPPYKGGIFIILPLYTLFLPLFTCNILKILMIFLLLGVVNGCAQVDKKDTITLQPKLTTAEIKACDGISNRAKDNIGGNYEDNKMIWNDFNHLYSDSKPRKLAIFLDGTGNNKKDLTNIRQLYRLSVEHACFGNRIIPYYDKGVGAKWFDFASGGITGKGVSLNIRQAYRFLVRTYKPGDMIFIFGFSRGAFTARSLNGFIEFSGIIDKASIKPKWCETLPNWICNSSLHESVANIYKAYKSNDDGTPNFETKLRGKIKKSGGSLKFFPDKVTVTAIGVFDTVPALGISRNHDPDNHKVDLYALNGFHALALDEQRKDFRVKRFNPITDLHLEEVWFTGVHSNVGGGYDSSMGCNITDLNSEKYYDGLETTPLNWMISKFETFELFPRKLKFTECIEGKLHDEFFDSKNMLYGKLGISKRQPQFGDSIHSSVKDRAKFIAGTIKKPHPHREPNGLYLTPSLMIPLSHFYNIVP